MSFARTLSVAALCLMAAVSSATAGTLTNRDAETYEYAIYWDDMSEPVKGVINPKETVEFADQRGTIALIGQHDSIYVRPEEEIFILHGVMRKP